MDSFFFPSGTQAWHFPCPDKCPKLLQLMLLQTNKQTKANRLIMSLDDLKLCHFLNQQTEGKNGRGPTNGTSFQESLLRQSKANKGQQRQLGS
jgi:hypothetical protein